MSALLIMRLFQEEGSVKAVLDNGLTYEKIVTAATENCEEYYYKIRNNTDSDIFLDKFVMFECDSLESLGLHKDSRLFRSGRWYYYGLTVTYEDVKTNPEIMKKKQIPFDVFQIDEGWEKIDT